MLCGCGHGLEWKEVEEVDGTACFGQFECPRCRLRFGIEAIANEISPLLDRTVWTDEARHVLERLPPYVAPLVREEVEAYAQAKGTNLVTFAMIMESKNRGAIDWSPEAEQRLVRVPPAIRAMARIELERTALDRGMSEVTVDLMEEVKARYFGMRSAQPDG